MDWTDHDGARHQPQFPTREEAEDAAEQIRAELKAQPLTGHCDLPVDTTWDALFERVMADRVGPNGDLKPRTLEQYRYLHTQHLSPAFGLTPVRTLSRARLAAFLKAKRRTHATNTIRLMHATVHTVLAHGVDYGLLAANPASGLARKLKLTVRKQVRQQQVAKKAMTRAQRDAFLSTAERIAPWWARMWTVAVLTGLRPGEMYALEERDIDLDARTLIVARTLSNDGKRVDTPKNDLTRIVDLTNEATRTLRIHLTWRRAEKLRRAWPALPRPVFSSRAGTYANPDNVRRDFQRVCRAARLIHDTGRPAFTPHGLRHTYASLLLQSGVDVYYVQRQLGHADILLTAGTYGSAHRPDRRPNLDALDRFPEPTAEKASG